MVLKVWKQNSRIRAVKHSRYDREKTFGLGPSSTSPTAFESLSASVLQRAITKVRQGLKHSRDLIQANADGIRYYFSTTVWLPSVYVAVLHGSVLAWSGTLITWLLNAHFSFMEITVAKGIGSIFEIGSTFVFPWAVVTLLSES